VVIYIGAIAILMIFAIMLTRKVAKDSGPQTNSTWPIAGIVALVFFGGLVFLFQIGNLLIPYPNPPTRL